MNNDTIKLLNLEGINIDFNKSDIIKNNDCIVCNIVLTTINESCPMCGSVSYTIKDYRNMKIVHNISTTNSCVLNYKAMRYKCKD